MPMETDVAARSINILSLCSGVGGLDIGVELALGGAARVVCHVEREAFAAAILAARMEDAVLAPSPIWSDIGTFDGRPWRGIVDCVIGGYPCQPFSFAGKRCGADDPRHLWPQVARIVAECVSGIVFFENVAGHLTLGFPTVRRELEAMGYRVTAGLFTAEEVGAPHRRERLFILGVRDVADGQGGGCGVGGNASQPWRCGHTDFGNVDVGDATHDHRRWRECGAEEGAWAGRIGRRRPAIAGSKLADAFCTRSQGQPADWHSQPNNGNAGRGGGTTVAAGDVGRIDQWQREREERGTDYNAGGGCDLPLFPPGPGDLNAWRRILAIRPNLAPSTEPGVRGVADGMAGRLDRLRACGNGVVPLVAAYAFVSLWACLHER